MDIEAKNVELVSEREKWLAANDGLRQKLEETNRLLEEERDLNRTWQESALINWEQLQGQHMNNANIVLQ